MRGPRAAAILVSPAQRDVLQRIQRQQTADQRLVRRASLILALAAQPCIDAVARQLGLTRVTVRAWRDRWLEVMEVLRRAEQEQTPQQFRRLVEMILDDAPRPGKPATFTPEQIVQIIAVACEPPEQSGRPISHWTSRGLADEVQKRGIVAKISPRSVGRFFKRGRVTAAPQPLLAQCQSQRPRRLPRASRCGLRPL